MLMAGLAGIVIIGAYLRKFHTSFFSEWNLFITDAKRKYVTRKVFRGSQR